MRIAPPAVNHRSVAASVYKNIITGCENYRKTVFDAANKWNVQHFTELMYLYSVIQRFIHIL